MGSSILDGRRCVSPLRAGLTAGSIGAVAGVLVNLPLDSPSDAFFNSASVMAGSLLAGLGSGLLWYVLGDSPRRPAFFAVSLALVFGLVSAAAIVGESQLERSVSYIVPLAAIVLGLTGVLTVLLLRIKRPTSWRLTLLAIIVAVGLGVGLAGHGDQESGSWSCRPGLPWEPYTVYSHRERRRSECMNMAESITRARSLTAAIAALSILVLFAGCGSAADPTATAPAPTSPPATEAPPATPTTPPDSTETAPRDTSPPTPTTPSEQEKETPAPSAAPRDRPASRSAGEYDGISFIVSTGSEATFTVEEQLARLPCPTTRC